MCRARILSRMCPTHRARVKTYEHAGPRPVIQRIEFGYGGLYFFPGHGLQSSGSDAVTVYVELRISSGKARKRPPWTAVFCLTDRPQLSGTGLRRVVCNMVVNEIKRLGWGFARGVRCQP